MKKNTISMQYVLQNQISIPTKLLTDFPSLGLNEQEVLLVLQLHRFSTAGNLFPTPTELSACLTIDEQECSLILRKLIQKGLLKIEQSNDKQVLSEVYSLEGLWTKLFAPPSKTEEEPETGTIFVLFEQEFGRPLSPFEIETINVWLDEDQLMPALIKAALRESVLMGKLNFKYIDRILREWNKKGIQTVEDAREASKKFHSKQVQQQPNNPKRDTSFYYNWLEGE